MSRCAPQFALIAVLATSPIFGAARDEPIKPIPQLPQQNAARVELGRQLFNDARLSANNRTACSACHDIAKGGGADGRTRSVGFGGKLTAVNAPTVLNASLNFRQFWDGRADSLESQIESVVRNPVEMGSAWDDVVGKISAVATYSQGFKAAYADGVTKANIQNAIASYERALLTPDSRFDRYLRGDDQALSAAEKLGYAKFKQYGCVACHQGVNIGGNMFQKFGVMGDYFAERGSPPADADLGRYRVTGADADRNVFKVPSLRNIALTAPYFHDGSAATLDQAVEVMFTYQLGRVPSPDDRRAIVAFLNTLTGRVAGTP